MTALCEAVKALHISLPWVNYTIYFVSIIEQVVLDMGVTYVPYQSNQEQPMF